LKPEKKEKDNIMDLKEVKCEEADWIHLAHDRVLSGLL
jgi:hypothetical protein